MTIAYHSIKSSMTTHQERESEDVFYGLGEVLGVHDQLQPAHSRLLLKHLIHLLHDTVCLLYVEEGYMSLSADICCMACPS